MTIFENEEDDMHSTFEQLVSNHLNDKIDSYLFHEVRTGARTRVDFAVVHLDLDRVWERLVSYQNTEGMPRKYRSALRAAEKYCPIPKEELIDRSNYQNREDAETAVEWLIENNYLLQDSGGWYRIHRPQHVLNRIDVFELKIYKWEDALRQAKRYRQSIGETGYVVLDADRTRGAKDNLEEFKQSNIGLMAMDRESIEVIHNPRPKPQTRDVGEYRTSLSESAFKAFTDAHPSYPMERHERKVADDIGQYQNPLKARKTANEISRTLD